MKKRLKKILALALTCMLLAFSLPNMVLANQVLYDKYGIFDLDLTAIDNYIVLRLYDEEVYNLFTNYAICKNAHVQRIYSLMAERLTGDEEEAEVLKVFEEVTYGEAISSINDGAPISELIKSIPEKLKSLGVDVDAYEKLQNKEAVLASLKGKTFADLNALANSLKALVGEIEPGATNTGRFVDVFGDKLTEAVEFLAKEGIVAGKTSTQFYPNDNVKREEFAKMLVLALGVHNQAAKSDFTDVSSDDWYYTYVSSAVEKGLIEGYGEKFGSGDFITRQDVATIVYRALESTENIGEAASYADASEISDYAVEAVNKLTAAKIMGGIGDNKFAPKEFATRAQTAEIIYSLITSLRKGN